MIKSSKKNMKKTEKTSNLTLGLDMGTNSIGWAIIEHDNVHKPLSLADCGVRIFQEAVDLKTKVPKNRTRRDARSARRLVSRRKMRRDNLLRILLQNKLLPKDAGEREGILTDIKLFDPYQLRRKALDEKLTCYELGRVLYHLCQRRGFQSNRKAVSKDDGVVKTAISSLGQEMVGSESRTLGEYLASQKTKRRRYTDRDMYAKEIDAILEKQGEYYPDILSQALKVAIHNCIILQRPLKSQKNLVGKCTFETSRKRAPRALLEYQRSRVLQDLNHLTIKDPNIRKYRGLINEERDKLLKLLERQKTLTWNKARSVLGLHGGEIFNLEEGGKKGLIGINTAYRLRSILKEGWNDMTDDQKEMLVTDLLTIDNEQGLLNRMQNYWEFTPEISEELAKTELDSGYGRLSRKALCKILPFLEQGMTYDKACDAAGYDHSRPTSQKVTDKLGEPSFLRNPVVQKALYETRKVVNAIIRKHGKPTIVRIEMARDMKLSKKQKDKLHKTQNVNKKANEEAKEILQSEFNIQNPTRQDIQKYNMWVECKSICPYTGKTISREMLFSPEVDVEHILPYPRSLDDSYMNKTLCMADENRTVKHNRSPYEAYNANTENYQQILKRVETLPYPKRKRFEQEEIDTDKFVERQLNDTRYICTEVKEYIQQLGVKVEVTQGGATAVLRHRWNLNRVLADDCNMEKNREDHRHHTIDAIVIALTSRALFQRLSRLSASSNRSLGERGFTLESPWQSFYNDVCLKIEGIIVSHAPSRRITGALHEETAYGYSQHDECFVRRKPLTGLTIPMVRRIRDEKVKELVEERLAEYGDNPKKAFGDSNNPLLHVDGKTQINSVRITENLNKNTAHPICDNKGKPYKYFAYGNNHHVEIIENIKTGRREGVFVTAMEAAKRARRDRSDIVQKDHGVEWKFLMSLCVNDMVEVEDSNGQKNLYRVQVLDSSNKNIIFRLHTAAILNDDSTKLNKVPNSLRCRKIKVDPLGNITQCND